MPCLKLLKRNVSINYLKELNNVLTFISTIQTCESMRHHTCQKSTNLSYHSQLGAIQIIRDTLGGRGRLAQMSHDICFW
jgi:hypothetical protein